MYRLGRALGKVLFVLILFGVAQLFSAVTPHPYFATAILLLLSKSYGNRRRVDKLEGLVSADSTRLSILAQDVRDLEIEQVVRKVQRLRPSSLGMGIYD